MTATAAEAQELLGRPVLNVPDAAKVLGLGLATTYRMVRRGELRVTRVGNRILVPTSAINELLNPNAPAPGN